MGKMCREDVVCFGTVTERYFFSVVYVRISANNSRVKQCLSRHNLIHQDLLAARRNDQTYLSSRQLSAAATTKV
jgi:hypothetical protein